MQAVLTNQITDIGHFSDKISKASYFLISSYDNVAGFELSSEQKFAKIFN